MSLEGSYDCATWTRTASYGYPLFDGVNATILATTAANPSGNTLAIAGNTIGSGVVVDGVTVSRGWKLSTTEPCAIAQAFVTPFVDVLAARGGADDDLVDILGATRSPPISMGAYEYDGQCSP